MKLLIFTVHSNYKESEDHLSQWPLFNNYKKLSAEIVLQLERSQCGMCEMVLVQQC